MSTFEARYSGYCRAECGERIEAGDIATYIDGDLMHMVCVGKPSLPDRPVTVCQSCWLVQPCDCED
jgi:hypothetical protein